MCASFYTQVNVCRVKSRRSVRSGPTHSQQWQGTLSPYFLRLPLRTHPTAVRRLVMHFPSVCGGIGGPQGWVSGTGGGMSIKAGGAIVMAPSGAASAEALKEWTHMSHPNAARIEVPLPTKRLIRGDAAAGVPKERMQPSDMYVLNAAGEIMETPSPRPAPYKAPKLSECAPLFMSVRSFRICSTVTLQDAGQVLYAQDRQCPHTGPQESAPRARKMTHYGCSCSKRLNRKNLGAFPISRLVGKWRQMVTMPVVLSGVSPQLWRPVIARMSAHWVVHAVHFPAPPSAQRCNAAKKYSQGQCDA